MQQHFNSYRQAQREALWAVALALGYFIWWYCSAYGLAPTLSDPKLPPLYWGLPLWFLFSCVLGPILFTILCALMVKYLYRDLPLNSQPDNLHE